MFKFSDIYGLVGSMFVLVFVFLLLKNFTATNGLIGTTTDGTNKLLQTLQGR